MVRQVLTLPYEYQTPIDTVQYSDEFGIQVFNIQMVTVLNMFDARLQQAQMPSEYQTRINNRQDPLTRISESRDIASSSSLGNYKLNFQKQSGFLELSRILSSPCCSVPGQQ